MEVGVIGQGCFESFGPTDRSVAQWRLPVRMGPDIVALCQNEAHAIRLSLDFAKRRYGYRQQDVAELMKIRTPRLSEWRKPENTMPAKHRKWFCHATGCALLEQHIEDVEARKRATGQLSERERDAVIVALMARGLG
jgi:hypothetical protein